MVSLTVTIILASGTRLSDSTHAAKTSQAKMTRAMWGRDSGPPFFAYLKSRQAIGCYKSFPTEPYAQYFLVLGLALTDRKQHKVYKYNLIGCEGPLCLL